jgi:hypothetical protein
MKKNLIFFFYEISFLKAKMFVEQWSTSAKDIVERLKSSNIASHSVRIFFLFLLKSNLFFSSYLIYVGR